MMQRDALDVRDGMSAVDLAKHNILRSDDRHRIRNHVPARHFVERSKMRITRRTNLQSIRLVRAI